MTARDPRQQRQCLTSIRLMLCEHHADIPGEIVLATYLGAATLSWA
jgi:hypothetical protein